MRILLIHNDEMARKPESRQEANVGEVDVPMVEGAGLEGELRMFIRPDGSLMLHVPRSLEIAFNVDGGLHATNTLEIRSVV